MVWTRGGWARRAGVVMVPSGISVHRPTLLRRAHDGLFRSRAHQLGEQDQRTFTAMTAKNMLADVKQTHDWGAGDTARKSRAAVGAGVHGNHPEGNQNKNALRMLLPSRVLFCALANRSNYGLVIFNVYVQAGNIKSLVTRQRAAGSAWSCACRKSGK